MTKGEYLARLKIIQYLVWVRKSYEQLHGVGDQQKVLRGFNIEGFVPVSEIELQTGIKTSLIRLALKNCTFVVGKTGKVGGYRLSVAPKELNDKALVIKKQNEKIKNPVKWLRKVPLTMDDLMGTCIDSVFKKELVGLGLDVTVLKAAHEELAKTVLYEFPIHLF